MKYYSLKKILSKGAQYNVVFGERSNGKTYAALTEALTNYVQSGKQTALIRRWQEDFVGKRGSVMFDGLVANDEIRKLTKDRWTSVYYYASKWYLCRYDEDGKRIQDEIPFCYGFALSGMEHDKSTSYPNVTLVIFDEFISRTGYLTDEFVLFCNVISTIVRQRRDVRILMLGNTVSKYACPYFREMGLSHIKQQKEGTIDIYRYGNSELTVAVERTAPAKTGKMSDLYFAFDNPKLAMITEGAWEMGIYPHCPIEYRPKDVIYQFFITFEDATLHAEVVSMPDRQPFIFIHPKTTPIRDDGKYLVFDTKYSTDPMHRRDITRPFGSSDRIGNRIAMLFRKDQVYFSDNEVGEIVHAYLNWCDNNNEDA